MATNSKLSVALKGNKNAAKDGVNKAVTQKVTPKVGGAFASSRDRDVTNTVGKALNRFDKGIRTTSMETPKAYEKRSFEVGKTLDKTIAAIDKKYPNAESRIAKGTTKGVRAKVANSLEKAMHTSLTKSSQYSKGRRDAPARLKKEKASISSVLKRSFRED